MTEVEMGGCAGKILEYGAYFILSGYSLYSYMNHIHRFLFGVLFVFNINFVLKWPVFI